MKSVAMFGRVVMCRGYGGKNEHTAAYLYDHFVCCRRRSPLTQLSSHPLPHVFSFSPSSPSPPPPLPRYVDFPDGWARINVQFAVPLAALPRTSVRAYEGRIPAVLVMMRKYLVKHGGMDVVGIFRLAPEKDECDRVKKEINSGCFEGCKDVNVMSNLIKVWFREMRDAP